MAFDLDGARRAGYTDDEIAAELARQSSFDLKGARAAGYSAAEIIDTLRGPSRPLPDGVTPSDAGAGRGSVNPADVEPPAPVGDFGTWRGGRGNAPTKAPPAPPVTGGALDRPAGVQPGDWDPSNTADLEQMSKSPETVQHELDALRYETGRRQAPALSAAPTPGVVDTLLNKTVRKPLDDSLVGAVTETAGDMARGVVKAPLGLAKTGLDLVRFGADAVGADRVAGIAGAASDVGAEHLRRLDNPNGDHLVTGALQSLTTSLMGGLAAGEGGAIAAGSLQSAGDEYSRARNAGNDVGSSLEAGTVYGVAEYLGEKVGIPSLGRVVKAMSAEGKMPIRTALKEALKQQGEEQVTQAMQSLYDKFGSAGSNPNMTWDQYLDQVVDVAKQTAIMSAVTAGGGAAMHAAGKAMPAAPVYDAVAMARQRGFLATPPATQEIVPGGGSHVTFTEPDSPSAAAGLTPIVVPNIKPAPQVEVKEPAAEAAAAPVAAPEPQPAAVATAAPPVPAVADLPTPEGKLKQRLQAVDFSAPLDRAAQEQQAEPATAPAQPENHNAERSNSAPVETWLGRKGAGYSSRGDAEQALPGRAARSPRLDWTVGRLGDGRFQLEGRTPARVLDPAARDSSLHGPEGQVLQRVRGAGDQGASVVDGKGRVRELPTRPGSEAGSRDESGQAGDGRQLRAGKLSLGDGSAAGGQSALLSEGHGGRADSDGGRGGAGGGGAGHDVSATNPARYQSGVGRVAVSPAEDRLEATDARWADAQRAGVGSEARGPSSNVEGAAAARDVASARALDAAANEAATSRLNDRQAPTEAQLKAGNYAKGHIRLHGLDISIENPRGSERSGVDKGGKAWSVTMQHHYGYIKGTVGADKDHVDVFVGKNLASPFAFVIDQVHPSDGKFDEHKVVLGASSRGEALEIYRSNYAKGWKGAAGITQMTVGEFKTWVNDGAKKGPVTKLEGVEDVRQPETVGERGSEGTGRQLDQGAGSADTGAAGPQADGAGRAAAQAGAPAEAVEHSLRHFSDASGVDAKVYSGELDEHQQAAVEAGKLLGKTVTFVDTTGRKTEDGEPNMNGLIDDSGQHIFLDKDSSDGHLFVLMHEGVHGLDSDIRSELVAAVRPLVHDSKRIDRVYAGSSQEVRDEEVAAFLAQAAAKQPAFWAKVADRMGESSFGRFAREIIGRLDKLVARADNWHGEGLFRSMTMHAEAVRDAIADAYAKQLRRNGEQAAEPAQAEARASRRVEDFTDPEARTEVSTTGPVGKKAEGTGYNQKWVIDAADIKAAPKHVAKVIEALRTYNTLSGKGDAKTLMQELHDTVVSNLLWLHDLVPAKIRERAKLWYDGANKIATDWTKKYGIDVRQASGVLAVLSPQMDWFKNVSLAERVITTWRDRQNEAWTPAMTRWVESWVAASKKVEDKEARAKVLEDARLLEGRRLYELDGEDAAKFVRVFDETYNERSYRLVTPEGGFGDYVTTSDDGDASVTWGGFATIAKAISILNDGSFRNINDQLGGEHKVRNFYNNIIAPDSKDGHVTIDTHAVAAALVKALSGATQEVKDNFGAAGSNAATGAGGTYGLFADAYRDAAAQRGLLAREMQSITWEAVRALFPAAIKDKMAPQVDAIWNRFRRGELTREQARQEVHELSGGIRPMAWEGSDAGKHAADGGTSYETELAAEPKDRKARELEPVDTKDKVQVSLSAATLSIPGIKALYSLAQKGDAYAGQLLQDIALDSLRHLLGGTSAKIKADRATGLYGGHSEPSLSLSVTFTDTDRAAVLAGLAKFAENFNQEQIHVRQGTREKRGTSFDDGSYATPSWRIEVDGALDRKAVQRIIDKSGLYGLTFGDGFVEAYYVGDVNDEAAVERFNEGVQRARELLGKKALGADASVARLWPYGHGDGTIGYDRIRGDVSAGPVGASDTAKRVAEYLAGQKVKAFDQAEEITPEQSAKQREIAAVYESLPDNDLKNPRVRRAYAELAKALREQYEALPVKVEVRTGDGEPYASSDDMRRDVLDNNHLFIYGTTPETFGPAGVDFSGHPLLEDSGLKDINGKPLRMNDLLRAVHDYYAHTLSATQFGPRGEEAAWKNHMAATGSPWARWALTSETRGQNSWVNFRDGVDDVPLKDREFARQKAALLPVDYALTGDKTVDAPMKQFIAALPVGQRIGSKPVRESKRLSDQTETPAFKAWFGDSKVVDENGKPLVMYHGAKEKFDAFDASKIKAYDTDFLGNGFHFSSEKWLADVFAGPRGQTLPVYLSIQNPATRAVANKVGDRLLGGSMKERNWERLYPEARTVNDAVRERLTEMGYDGVQMSKTHFVAFRPEQIKSATDNSGTFSSKEADLRKSLRMRVAGEKQRFGREFIGTSSVTPELQMSDLKTGNVKSDKAVDMLTYAIDSEYPIINAVRKAGGDQVSEAWQQAVEALPGKTADAIERFHRQYIEPMTKTLGVEAKKLDMEAGQLVDAYGVYRLALHAPERNATLLGNGAKKENPSGMSNTEALQWTTFFGGEPELLAAFKKIDPLLKDVQDATDKVKLQAGLLTQEEIDARDDWDHYINLQGDPALAGVGGGRSGTGWNDDTDKSAKGRNSLSANPVVNTVAALENAVRLAELARVKKATYEFALAHPKVIDAKVERIVRRPIHDANGNFVTAIPNVDKYARSAVVYRQGNTEYHIDIGDERVAEALKRLNGYKLDPIAKNIGRMTSVLGRLLTQFNPHFPLVNAIRDVQQQLSTILAADFVGTNNQPLSSTRIAFDIVTKWPRTFSAAVGEVFNTKGNGKYRRAARELIENGGSTGLTHLLNDEQKLTDFVKEVKQKAGQAKASLAWEKVVGAVEGISEVFELTGRVAVFATLRQHGASPALAANVTKNLMNFNKAGTGTRGWAGQLFMFLRPSVTDVYNTSKLLRSKKGAIVFAAMTASSSAMYAMLRQMSGDDDEDKRLKRMDKRQAQERRSYYILPVGGDEPVRIPVGFGLPRLAWGLGVTAVDAMLNPDADWKDAVDGIWKSAGSSLSPMQLSDINMLKDPGGFLATTMAPTLLEPAVELAMNKTRGGQTIRASNPTDTRPNYARGFSSTPKEWKDAAQWMYDHTDGRVDMTPESLQYLVRTYTGGPGGVVLNALATREKLRSGDALSAKDVPVVQAFVGPKERYAERQFRELTDQAKQMKAGIEDAMLRNPDMGERWANDEGKALLMGFEKQVVALQMSESKALKQLRTLQVEDYDTGAKELRLLELEFKKAKQEMMNAYNQAKKEIKK